MNLEPYLQPIFHTWQINLIQAHRTTLSQRPQPLPLLLNTHRSDDYENMNRYVNIAQIRQDVEGHKLGHSKSTQTTERLSQLLFAFVQAGALTVAS